MLKTLIDYFMLFLRFFVTICVFYFLYKNNLAISENDISFLNNILEVKDFDKKIIEKEDSIKKIEIINLHIISLFFTIILIISLSGNASE